MSTNDYQVPMEDALRRLAVVPDYDDGSGPGPCVHTFVDSAIGLLGAHWPLGKVRELIEEHGVEEAGEFASSSGHALVVLRPAPLGPLFLGTTPEEAA